MKMKIVLKFVKFYLEFVWLILQWFISLLFLCFVCFFIVAAFDGE